MKSMLINLMTSKNINYFWNLGSLLGMIFALQFLSGLFLLFYYSNEATTSFFSVNYIMMESKLGWMLRILHFNGASLFFIFLFMHFFKGILNFSYRLKLVWTMGILILIIIMLEAFSGYCLVWAQMSFWASVVITSLISVIPIFGMKIVYWVWGGFSVSYITLKFFFVIHFIMPFLLILMIFSHLIFLHSSGSTSKIYVFSNMDKIMFYNYFWYKDLLNILVFLIYFILIFFLPFKLGDPEMFIESDFLNSPVHIVPEWYFLFAYAILRAIPNKILGVISLLMSLIIWMIFIFINFKGFFKDIFIKMMSILFMINAVFISWLGQCLVEGPFVSLSMIFSFIYFFLVLLKVILLKF